MTYKFYYWPMRGRGEQIRLLLHELGQKFEDIHIKPDGEFQTLKKQGANTLYFKSVPMLQDGDFKLVQGPVIMNYLGRKHGLMSNDLQLAAKTEAIVLGAEDMRMAYFRAFGDSEEAIVKQKLFVKEQWKARWLPSWNELLELNGDTGFFIGNQLTQADLAVWDAMDAIVDRIEGAGFDDYDRLVKFYESISCRPGITGYLNSRK